ncbi:DUF6779 domain-containing protein [[Mycobacterium] crassicus]|uniref:DUF6779 domain-containing protein n=1 Tax=[Mycobacterium] crassicus TaxID=2872309 RepID=A0ABU5XH26_9MYCO|nr:DUF6779 domain-containing protein [Mycolicibacter sp. MYC098]MEB3021605.1 DUF6779 domain-containing protein [Mycolicibacter sp. MYC098]
MNSVLSRAPGRRGARRPGWTLMTALLILAIAASSALVFTSRVELLKLAVIVALWAAVAAAFVSVIYRRQSDVDQARARDLKLVYDLQLDREISARREYELTVESQLRRELASELRAQAADEVAALRTELSALRTNLEILFDADLSHRPALEQERTTVRAYSDWARTGGESDAGARVAPAGPAYYPEDPVTQTAENPIIDVPEVRIPTGTIPVPQAPSMPPPTPDTGGPAAPGDNYRGSHRRAGEEGPRRGADETQRPQPAAGRWAQPPQPFGPPEPRREPEYRREPEPPQPVPPPPAPPQQPPSQQPWAAAPAPAPAAPPAPAAAAAPPAPAPAPAPTWQPVGAEGEWLPSGAPGSNWSPDIPDTLGGSGRHGATESRHSENQPAGAHAAGAPDRSAEGPARHSRHSGAVAPEGGGRRRADRRHAEDVAGSQAQPTPVEPSPPAPVLTPTPTPEPESGTPVVSRHSSGAETGADGEPSTGGQSVADLLARLQTVPTEGRRRRRRAE